MRHIHFLVTSLQAAGFVSLLGTTNLSGCVEPEENTGQPSASGDASAPVTDGGPYVATRDGSSPAQDSGTDGGAPTANGIPCAVKTILRDKCTTCHAEAPLFGAPMSLASYAAFQAPARSDSSKKVAAVSATRINATGPLRMPPAGNTPPLTAPELTALDTWLAAGAPMSTETCNAPPPATDGGVPAPSDTGDLDCYKLLAHEPDSMASKYKVGTAQDVYSLFSFKAPWQGEAYGILLRPIIDNAKVLHHWLLFQTVGSPDGAVVRDAIGAHPTGDLVHGWAPGGNALDFRQEGDVGFEFPVNTTFEVEIHYNSSDPVATDASGVEICVQKKKPANIAGVSWLGSDLFNGTKSTSTCKPFGGASLPINIVAVSPHMHLKGRHMKATVIRADQTTETLHDAPFDFNSQTWYPAKFQLNKDDVIRTECTFSAPSSFGKDTTEEMCYLFTVAYPKGALTDQGPVGTAAHGGGACLGELYFGP